MSLSSRSKAKAKAASSKTKNPALDSRARELLDKQSELQAQIDALQRTIEQAPRQAAEEQRRSREAYVGSPSSRERPQYRSSATLVDKRYVDAPEVKRAKSRPMLRAERRAAQRQTLALLVLLAAVAIWALHWLLS